MPSDSTSSTVIGNGKINLLIPGEIQITRMDLISNTGMKLDIKLLVQQCDIFEDLFASSVTGILTIVESLNLVHHFPITGGEFLFLDFNTPSCPNVQMVFRICKISDRIKYGKQSAQMYKLHFCSPEFYADGLILLSKAYNNMPYHEMVQKIWLEYLNSNSGSGTPLKFAKTAENKTLVVPQWSPMKTINWIARRSTKQNNAYSSNFLFYQDLDSYKFVSLDDLYSQQPVMKYVVELANLRDVNDRRNIEHGMHIVENYAIKESFDRLTQMRNGTFFSHAHTHDITTKRFGYFEYVYPDEFSRTNHVTPYPLTRNTDFELNNHGSHQRVYSYATRKYDDLIDGDRPETWLLSNEASINQILSTQVEIEVPGDSRRRVGDIVEFDIPSPEEMRKTTKSDAPIDKYMSGKYLVTSINHSFSPTSYKLTMELSKDSLFSQLPDIKTVV